MMEDSPGVELTTKTMMADATADEMNFEGPAAISRGQMTTFDGPSLFKKSGQIRVSTKGVKRPGYKRRVKPPLTYIQLISVAIQDSPQRMLTLREILAALKKNHTCFRGSYVGWKNSVRHNLSASDCFLKLLRRSDSPFGKDNFWTMNPDCPHCNVGKLDDLKDETCTPDGDRKLTSRNDIIPSWYGTPLTDATHVQSVPLDLSKTSPTHAQPQLSRVKPYYLKRKPTSCIGKHRADNRPCPSLNLPVSRLLPASQSAEGRIGNRQSNPLPNYNWAMNIHHQSYNQLADVRAPVWPHHYPHLTVKAANHTLPGYHLLPKQAPTRYPTAIPFTLPYFYNAHYMKTS